MAATYVLLLPLLLLLSESVSAAYVPAAMSRVACVRNGAARAASPLAVAVEDPYSTLGVQRTATAAQIKQAYRRMALRSHPDVNKAPDAEQTFAKIAEAYSLLSDEKKRAQFDRRPGSWASSSSSSSGRRSSSSTGNPFGDFDPTDPVGWASRPRDPAAQAAAEERRRRWKEENPSPDELGDSFGALLNDVVSAVAKVAGGKDWLSLLDELALTDGPELQTLLRSRDASMLKEELESAKWVQQTLSSRIKRLDTEATDAESDLATFQRENSRVSGGTGAGSMSKSLERELERDLRRRKERAADARRLLEQARSREQRIAARLDELKNGPPSGGSSGSYRSGGKPRSLPSVDDELQKLKRQMGQGK